MSRRSDIRHALGDMLTAALDGVYVYPFSPDTTNVPAVIIYGATLVDFQEVLAADLRRYVMPIQCRVQRVVAESADDELDDLVDQVYDALTDPASWDGTFDSVMVVAADSYGTVTNDDGVEYLACNVNVEVLA